MRFALCLLISLILHALVAWRISLFRLPGKLHETAALERSFVEISISDRDVESAPPSFAQDLPAVAAAPKPPEVRLLVSEVVHEGSWVEYSDVPLPEPTPDIAELPRELMEAPEQAHIEGEEKPSVTMRAKYPKRSRERGEEGEVVVEVEVTDEGRAFSVRIVATSGHPLLDKAALEAAKKAVYKPAMRDGRPVAESLLVRFVFRLTI